MSDKAKLHSLTKALFIPIVLIFLAGYSALGQKFDPKIAETKWTIQGKATPGYSTDFDMSAKVVEKEFWRYSKAFSRPLNMKTYYRHIIPAEQGGADIELLSRTIPGKYGSTFFLTVNENTIPSSMQQEYLKQVKTILQEFKQGVYLEILEDQLKKEEKRAKKLSKKVDKAGDRAKEKTVKALMTHSQKLESLREQVKEIYQAY